MSIASAVTGIVCVSKIGGLPEARTRGGDLPLRLVIGFVGSVAMFLLGLIMFVR